ncbi:hypothetical protein K435DRAFT_655451 [Dendrothele bispora CBS 962.96]|uniref:Uncharacterized protein n=1 Tax=Dendrothele bispora (strain CBS 962.96) TaxID=1314807 RepID=A0A4S8MH18_DENBC|nr:hypothetical protein K435DRAFT_655451 [Dendrothele bispora CBS 962.96]
MSTAAHTNGFPEGYFVIRSAATGRIWDVSSDSKDDGTEIILWPEKDTSLVDGRRNKSAENQVFFIDTSGALCSRDSGHAVDIEGDKLVLRHRRPVISPYPNSYSHPPAKFVFSKESGGEIQIQFEFDPSYPPPSAAPSEAWKEKTFLLTAIPKRKPKGKMLSSLFGGSHSSTADDLAKSGIDLADNEILDEDLGEEGEVDDSPDTGRDIRMLAITDKKKRDKHLLEKTKMRRTWQIIKLRNSDARTGKFFS